MYREALFSDLTENYITPMEPKAGDTVVIRFRTDSHDKVKVELVSEGGEAMELQLVEMAPLFDYYAVCFEMPQETLVYHFRVSTPEETCYFDRMGVSDYERPEYAFRLIPGYYVPDWAKGAIMYQIFVDRFCNGDATNDVLDGEYYYVNGQSHHISGWSDGYNIKTSVNEFYGGDLAGVISKLDYLKGLGVEVIYLNPIFVSPSNHKYDTMDYDHVDPHFGRIVKDEGELLEPGCKDNSKATRHICRVTDQANLEASDALLAELIEAAHQRGMKVILDGVFNHCGSFNKWLNREGIYSKEYGYPAGAYEAEDSPYHEFFHFAEGSEWPDNGTYEGWWDYDTLPKLNYDDCEELCEYIVGIGKKWVSEPYNADGWRLDVGADLGHTPEVNHRLWERFREGVRAANPEAIILGEHYEDPSPWFGGKEWDTIMNYEAFMDPVTNFITGVDKHSDHYDGYAKGDANRFRDTILHFMSRFPGPSLSVAMNELSNHDHSRFLSRTNGVIGRVENLGMEAAEQGVSEALFKLGVMLQMTWPGAPTIYYGDEAGLCGFTDPDNRRTYPWGRENHRILDFHRDMNYIHKYSQALRRGSLRFLATDRDVIVYSRFTREESCIIAINVGPADRQVHIPAYLAEIGDGILKQMIISNEEGYSCFPKKYEVKNGWLKLELTPGSGVVLGTK